MLIGTNVTTAAAATTASVLANFIGTPLVGGGKANSDVNDLGLT
jgi:hypothetical protein